MVEIKTEGEVIVTPVSRLWIDEEGILRWVYNPGAVVTVEEAQEEMDRGTALVNAYKGKGGKVPLLIDIRPLKSVTREARQLYSSQQATEGSLGVAILMSSPLTRVVGNFFASLNRPEHRLRLFTSESKAIAWLRGLLYEQTDHQTRGGQPV